MARFKDLLDNLSDLLGKRPEEISEAEFGVMQRALNAAIQIAWPAAWWPETMHRMTTSSWRLWPVQHLRFGDVVYYAAADDWYQFVGSYFPDWPPATQQEDGTWRTNPTWVTWSTDLPARWQRELTYAAGSRVLHGADREYVTEVGAPAGLAPDDPQAHVWLELPRRIPPALMKDQGPAHPPIGRVKQVEYGGGWMWYPAAARGPSGRWFHLPALITGENLKRLGVTYQTAMPVLNGQPWDASLTYQPPDWTDDAYWKGKPPAGGETSATTPVIEPDAGEFYDAVTVTITCDTPGAVIRYTVDGSYPTATYGTVYTGPFSLESSATVRAIATKFGLNPSGVAQRQFVRLWLVRWGLANEPVLDGAGIAALANQRGGNGIAGTYSVTPATDQYLFFAWPEAVPAHPRSGDGFLVDGLPLTGDLAGATEGYPNVHNGWPYLPVTVAGKPWRLYRTKERQGPLAGTINVQIQV
jgi:hypothetical protein